VTGQFRVFVDRGRCRNFDLTNTRTMRSLITPTAVLLALATTAQVDVSKMLQERMGGGGVITEDDKFPFVPNEFIGSFRMEMHMYEGEQEQKNSPTNMRYWSSAEKTVNKMEMPDGKGQDMRIMTDLKEKWQYTLMTDDKGRKTAMKSRKKKFTVKEEPGAKDPEITVTTETKTIDGHMCTKTIVKSEDGTWTGWVAKDIKAPFADMARSVGHRGNDKMMRSHKGMNGFPLEFEWVDANGKDRMVCYVKELTTGAVEESVFSLDGYEVMEMPSFGQ
jgi:Domain of unknown function (DUF4412)